MTDYTVSDSRYAKGKKIVRIPPGDGFKSRAHRLIGHGLGANWVNREEGYSASPAKVAKFERLYAEGWDASIVTGELKPPQVSE